MHEPANNNYKAVTNQFINYHKYREETGLSNKNVDDQAAATTITNYRLPTMANYQVY